ncbi:TOTE conflict system archaeo-eukaryotic primase domain-containing protein [Aliidongia sp.]|uniref:TOTE conflict system archaeo-eukaryotic primase domain-containing protein n=1 Tax=Aliidongia sp. TaxID=1914230 RepID=UPI0039C8B581
MNSRTSTAPSRTPKAAEPSSPSYVRRPDPGRPRSLDKAGYSPVCRNEWVRGVCGKPQVMCGECSSQAFVLLSDDALRSHLTGDRSLVPPYALLPANFGQWATTR